MYLLEPILQSLRISKVVPHLKPGCVLVDLGCDKPPILLQKVSPTMNYCIGIDEAVSYAKKGNIEIFSQKLSKEIKLESEGADYITMLAVLEHLKYPLDILKETYRILRPGGSLLITVPSSKSKLLLELMSLLKLVRPEMIDQHENYFDKDTLLDLLKKVGYKDITINTFELGFNIFVKATK